MRRQAWDPDPDRHARINEAIDAALAAAEAAMAAHLRAHERAIGVNDEVAHLLQRREEEQHNGA